MIKLIGIGGKKRSGKDSVCNVLVKRHGFTRMAFADNLRTMCAKVFDVPPSLFLSEDFKEAPFHKPIVITYYHLGALQRFIDTHHGYMFKQKGILLSDKVSAWNQFLGFKLLNPRHILQVVGTDMIRNHILDSYHADVIFDIIKKNVDKLYCISDCRFPNEREIVKEFGGITVLVKSHKEETDSNHASETSVGDIEDYDFVIENKYNGLINLAEDVGKAYESYWK